VAGVWVVDINSRVRNTGLASERVAFLDYFQFVIRFHNCIYLIMLNENASGSYLPSLTSIFDSRK
jgi:hypothetical protein